MLRYCITPSLAACLLMFATSCASLESDRDTGRSEREREVRVALVQFDAVAERPERNLREMERLAREAAAGGARIIMFHEGTLTDYTPRLAELAQEVPEGSASQAMIRLARELDCVISFGLSERDGDRYYISQVFVGPSGLIHCYRKTWLFPERKDEGYRDEWARYDPGTGPELFTIDGITATCMICADGESARCIDRVQGMQPELVFYPNNRQKLPAIKVFGERAARIGAPMLVSNRVGKSWDYDCAGGCVVYGADGAVLAEANRDGREEILYHDLQIPPR